MGGTGGREGGTCGVFVEDKASSVGQADSAESDTNASNLKVTGVGVLFGC